MNNPPYAPVGLSNILFAEYAVYFVLGRIQGIFLSSQQFEAAYRADPTIFYLLARLTSAVLGSLTVLPVYWLGRILRPKKTVATGLLAASLVAVGFLYVRDAHYGVPDVAMSFAVTLAVSVILAGVNRGRNRLIYLGGLAAGAAISMKWTALPVALPVLLGGLLVAGKNKRDEGSTARLRTLFVTALCMALGFALTSPQVIINPGPYVREAFGQLGAGQAGGFEIWQVDSLPGWLFYLKTLSYGLGVLMGGLALLGVANRLRLALRCRDRLSYLLLAFPVAYFVVMGATRHYFARYALPLVPFAAVFAADAIVWLAGQLAPRSRPLAWAAATALVLAAIAQPLAASVQHDWLLSQADTRTQAKAWIEANIPAGARIAMDWPTHGPPLSTPERPLPGAARVYDVTLVGGTGLADHPIAWYRENGFDYLIASSFIYSIPLVYPQRDAERRAFYASLEQELELVQEFRPNDSDTEPPFIFDEIYGPAISLWQRKRTGPVIRIYKIR
ncbi:MAG TPA: phospholipid carrier-dependent glycosyltransferase [Chloroflexi bacterium]|nr:phospholipid carrier-dependent glycosyltransferase [Chloroflexota bacterium]